MLSTRRIDHSFSYECAVVEQSIPLSVGYLRFIAYKKIHSMTLPIPQSIAQEAASSLDVPHLATGYWISGSDNQMMHPAAHDAKQRW